MTRLPGSMTRALLPGLILLALAGPLPPARAQTGPGPAADTHHTYDIPAGPLDQVLARFGRESGTQIAVNADLTDGQNSPGVRGSLTANEALQQLLAGTGLQAVRDASGEVTLHRPASPASSRGGGGTAAPAAVGAGATAGGGTTMPAIRVSAQRVVEGTTEGSGSYAPTYSDSATRMNLSPRETPQSITVFTSQMIEDQGVTSVEDLLNRTPGVSMIGDASQNSQIFVRGFSMESGIFIDGLNTTPAAPVYEGSLSQGLDPAIADRVEVVKGATGIISGLGAPSAYVNFIRKRPTREFQASGEIGLGSWKRRSAEIDVSGPLTENGNVRGRFVAATRSGNSFIDRYSDNKTILYGIIDVDLTPSTVASLAIDYQRWNSDGSYNWNSNPAFYTDGSVFRPATSFSTGQSWTYWNTSQASITPTVEHRFDNGWTAKLALRAGRGKIDRVNFYPGNWVDRATGEIVGGFQDAYADRNVRHSDTNSADAYASGKFNALGREHDLVFGVTYGRNTFSMLNTNSLPTGPYTIYTGSIPEPAFAAEPASNMRNIQQQAGLFATTRLNLTDASKLMVGGRLSNWQFNTIDRLEGSDTKVKHSSIFTPYLGLLYDIQRNVTVYASYTGTFRPNTYRDASGKLLDPAEGYNREIGVKMALLDNKLNLSIAAYQALENNFPEWANQGRLPSGDWIYRSIDGVKTNGFEVEVAGQISPAWQIAGGYTFNSAKDAEGDPKLTYVPKHLLKVATSYKWNQQLTLGGVVRYQGGSYYETTVGTPSIDVTQRQKAYGLLDLMGRWQFSRQLALTVNLNNVFNKTYYRSMWGYADYGQPRNVLASLRYTW